MKKAIAAGFALFLLVCSVCFCACEKAETTDDAAELPSAYGSLTENSGMQGSDLDSSDPSASGDPSSQTPSEGADDPPDGGDMTENGLEVKLNADKSSYSVIGIGIATDAELEIPQTYRDLPVTGIAESAFAGTNITKITIPATVVTIGKNAFSGCDKLTQAVFEASVFSIEAMPDELFPIEPSELNDSARAAILLKETFAAYVWIAA